MKKVVSLIAVAFLVSLLVCPCFGEQFSSAEETDEITESQAKEHKSEEHFCITMDGGSMQNTLDDGEELYVDMSEYGSVWQCSPMDSNNTAESAPRFSYGIPARLDIVVCRYPARGTVNFVKRIVGLPGETVALSMDGYLLIDGKMVMEETLIENITEEYRRGSGPFLDCYVPKKGDTAVLLQNSKTRDGLDIFINGQEWNRRQTCLIMNVDGKTLKIYNRNADDSSRETNGNKITRETVVSYDGINYSPAEFTASFPDMFGRDLTVDEDYYFVMGDHRNNSNDSRTVGVLERSAIIGHVLKVVSPVSRQRMVR